MGPFLELNNNFLPVLLVVTPENFDLLAKRMRERGDSEEKIAQRLKLANDEYKQMNQYQKITKDHSGLIFEVKDNLTVPNLVIPQILKLFR